MLSIWCWHCGISYRNLPTRPDLLREWPYFQAWCSSGWSKLPLWWPFPPRRSAPRSEGHRTPVRERESARGPPSPSHPRYWSSLQGNNSKTRFWGAQFWKIPHIGWCSRCASLQIQPWRCRALGKQTPSCYIPAANFSAVVSCQKLASNEQRAMVLESFHQEPYFLTVISEGNVGHRPPNWPKYWSPRSHWLWCLGVLKAKWTSSCAIMKVSELCCHLLGVSVAIYINHFNEKIMMFSVYHWIMAKFSWFSGFSWENHDLIMLLPPKFHSFLGEISSVSPACLSSLASSQAGWTSDGPVAFNSNE